MATLESLTQPLLSTISAASTLCAAIRTTHHCGAVHTQLDLLETSLLDSASATTSYCAGLGSAVVAESVRKRLEGCKPQLALICWRLESIARPSSHTASHHADKHERKHHAQHKHDSERSGSDVDEKEGEHHHKHHSKPLMFSTLDPIHHRLHRKEV